MSSMISLIARISWMPGRRVVLAFVVATMLVGCGEDEAVFAPVEGAGAEHIHGLGVNPADESLMIATHTGLFRAPPGEAKAGRVGDKRQDTMGFTVIGPDEFLGSGHPDLRDDLPPLLGLIRSNDGGRSWAPVSLLGEADFHVLRARGRFLYGFDATRARLLVSADGGRSWQQRTPPAPVIDIAIDPRDALRVVASTEAGLFSSLDGGRRWRPLARRRAGLLAWLPNVLVLVDGSGAVHRSSDGGRAFARVGRLSGQPAALASHEADLYVALHTNEIMVSSDAGRSWRLRAAT
jgi:hypothetical protein